MNNIDRQARILCAKSSDIFDNPSGTNNNSILIGVHKHIKYRLLRYINPESSLYKELHDQLDEKIFSQMIENDVFTIDSLRSLINTVYYWIKRLHAPVRDEVVDESKQCVLEAPVEQIVSTFIHEATRCIDLLDKDAFIFSLLHSTSISEQDKM